LKAKVWELLDKNPLLSPIQICHLLSIDSKAQGGYVRNLKLNWKRHSKYERGSKSSCFPDETHAWKGWTSVPRSVVDRYWKAETLAIGSIPAETVWRYPEMFPYGSRWQKTRARNRWILWKDRLGRLELFLTGRVNVYVRKPATVWKVKQLLAHAFMWTGLIEDEQLFERMVTLAPDGLLRFHGAHYLFDMGMRLPKATIDYFQKSNGITIKVGDRSHPDKIEVIASQPSWGERVEILLDRWVDVMEKASPLEREVKKGADLEKPERLWYVG